MHLVLLSSHPNRSVAAVSAEEPKTVQQQTGEMNMFFVNSSSPSQSILNTAHYGLGNYSSCWTAPGFGVNCIETCKGPRHVTKSDTLFLRVVCMLQPLQAVRLKTTG